MNILREVRRVNEKSMLTRVRLLLTFSIIFITSTYAWYCIDKNVKMMNLEADVTSWDVAYYVDNNEVLDQTAEFTIAELYPGMPERGDVVNIYNMGTSSTIIQYELVSVKVFGQEVLSQLRTDGEIVTEGNTTKIFSKDTQYPFKITYTYDKTKLEGKFVDKISTPDSFATFQFNASWDYDIDSTDAENLDAENRVKDTLDTNFGKDAYEYYQNEENDPTKAIEIRVKITSNMVHPNLDT